MYSRPENQMPEPQPGTSTMEQPIMAQRRITWCEYLRQLWESIRMTVFIVGTALIVFVCARNTVTWQLQRMWGASGDYWQHYWEKIHDLFGGDEDKIAILGTLIVTYSVFWLGNAFFMILDLTGHPQALLKYKIQDNTPLDREKFKKAIVQVIFNQTIMGIPHLYATAYVMKWRGCDFGLELPTFSWVVVELVVFSLVEEVMFYYSHRLLHHPRLYKYIHKRHHEWTAPIGIISIYAHPLEHVISNMLPPVMGPILMGSHIATAWMWYSIALMSTTIAHCGYHLPFLPSPEAHDFHHLKFSNNFGVLGVLDRLHGTDTMFRASKAYQRHFLLLALTPVAQQVPDDPKKGKKPE